MAVCESCGAQIQEGLTVCSQCGKPIVKMKTHLELRGENGRKAVKAQSFSPTDNYGDIYDGNSVGGTDPVKLTKEDIKENKQASSGPRKTSGIGKFFSLLMKIVVVAAIGFGIYYLVKNVILKPDGPETYQEALDLFQEAVNENDEEKLLDLVPGYITANKALVEDILPLVEQTEYTTITVIKVTNWTANELSEFNDRVQLEHGDTVDAQEGVTLKLGLRGRMLNKSGVSISYMEVELNFVKLQGAWYPDMEMVKNKLFLEN